MWQFDWKSMVFYSVSLNFLNFCWGGEKHVIAGAKVWPFLQSKRPESRFYQLLAQKIASTLIFISSTTCPHFWKTIFSHQIILVEMQKAKAGRKVTRKEVATVWKVKRRKKKGWEKGRIAKKRRFLKKETPKKKQRLDSWLKGDQMCFKLVWSPSTSCLGFKSHLFESLSLFVISYQPSIRHLKGRSKFL